METTQRDQFMGDCVKRLSEEVDYLIYFAINTKGINPQSGPKFSKYVQSIYVHLIVNILKQYTIYF